MIPPKPKRLKSQRFRIVIQKFHVEGFTRDGHGSDIPNGIDFVYIRKRVEDIKG